MLVDVEAIKSMYGVRVGLIYLSHVTGSQIFCSAIIFLDFYNRETDDSTIIQRAAQKKTDQTHADF